jgi:hypothetical protein
VKRVERITIELRHPDEKTPVPIVSNAAIASRGVADGRLIPLFILDTSKRPDIDDMILAHREFGPGDSKTIWIPPAWFNTSRLRLVVEITMPSRCVIVMEFDVQREGGVIDQVMQSEAIYIQAGRPGDRLINAMDRPRVSVEVPSKHFHVQWERLWRKSLVKEGRQSGMSRADAELGADRLINDWRDATTRRMKSEYDQDHPDVDKEPE